MNRSKFLLLSAAVLALGGTTTALATGEGDPILGGERNPGVVGDLTSETEIIANNSTYGTRQSNKSDNGGGAIYGCRSKPGGTPAGQEPCIRVNNLVGGRAFEFVTQGAEGGRIEAVGGANAKPFTTNATGVATGLNADQVDGRDAEQIAASANRFAQVTDQGALGTQRGVSSAARTNEGTYTVVFAEDVSGCALDVEVSNTTGGITGVEVGNDKRTVTVVTRNAANGQPADRPFHLTANC